MAAEVRAAKEAAAASSLSFFINSSQNAIECKLNFSESGNEWVE